MAKDPEDPNRALDRATALWDTGRTLRSWLAKLEGLRGSVRPRAWERVRDDYRSRLSGVDSDLAPLRATLRERVAAKRISLASLESSMQSLTERRDEATLRHHIGEMSEEEFREGCLRIDTQIAATRRNIEDGEADIRRIDALFADGEPRPETTGRQLVREAIADVRAQSASNVGRDTVTYSGPILVVAHATGQQTLKLGFGTCTIGSASGSDVVLSGTGVLSEHASISFQHDHHVVVGAGPVEHNGKTVAKASLSHGDRLRINGVEMIFVEVERFDAAGNLDTAGDLGTWMTPRALIEEAQQAPSSPDGSTVMYVPPVLLLRRAGMEQRISLDFGSRTIGSSPSCDIVVAADTDVLPQHAAVYFEHDHYVVVAADTVQVNGKTTSRAKVSHGDVIKIGRTEIHFTAGK